MRRGHDKKKEELGKQSELSAAHARTAGSVGLRAGRTAYHIMMHSLPRDQFEKLIVLQYDNDLNMGDKCHSGMPRFRDAFCDVVLTSECCGLRMSKQHHVLR